jgi:hypothetical protein
MTPTLTSDPTRSCAIAGLLADHYGCGGPLADFQIAGGLAPEPGYFRFGPGTICYGRSTAPQASTQPVGPLHDALGDVTAGAGVVRLSMDPREVIDNLRHERYSRDRSQGRARLSEIPTIRTIYYDYLRPFLPVGVRKHLQRLHLRNWRDIPFPQWPVDATVEQVLERLLLLSMKTQGVSRLPFIWFWPDGARSAAIMTHDVEGVAGRDFCTRLMDLDDAVSIKSSFQLVPEKRYRVPHGLLDEMRTRGFEINIHDLNHDGRLFSSHTLFLRWAERLNEYGRTYRALGFRSGGLYRNQAWYAALDFSYDMSVPSTAHLEPQRGGCCSLMPFFIGKILELPVTTTQDYSLFHILNDYSIDLWKRQLDSIAERHGLASFIVHPDYIIEPRARRTYRLLLDHLARMREERRVWVALPREVDRWWRARRQMTLLRDGTTWSIEGPDKERARLAYATIAGDRLTFEPVVQESDGARA